MDRQGDRQPQLVVLNLIYGTSAYKFLRMLRDGRRPPKAPSQVLLLDGGDKCVPGNLAG
jgi:hypothetical protein